TGEAPELLDLARKALPRAAARTDDGVDADEARRVMVEVLGEEAVADAERGLPEPARMAAARALRCAKRCSPMAELPVRRIAAWDPSATLRIDEVAQAHLELGRSTSGNKAATLLA